MSRSILELHQPHRRKYVKYWLFKHAPLIFQALLPLILLGGLWELHLSVVHFQKFLQISFSWLFWLHLLAGILYSLVDDLVSCSVHWAVGNAHIMNNFFDNFSFKFFFTLRGELWRLFSEVDWCSTVLRIFGT